MNNMMKNPMRSRFMTNTMLSIILVFWIIITNNTMAACSFLNGFKKATVTLSLPDITKLPGDKTLTSDFISVDSQSIFGAGYSERIAACSANETMVTGNSSYTVKDTILETNIAGVKLYGSSAHNSARSWRYPSNGDNYVSTITNSGMISPSSIGGGGKYGSWSTLYVRREVDPITQGGIVDGGLVFKMSTSDGLDIIDVYIDSFAVIVPACEINDYNKNVDLGGVSQSKLNSLGATANETEFVIAMTCGNKALTPTLSFEGNTDPTYVGVFSNPSGNIYAKGVGVRLAYGGEYITPGTPVSLKVPHTSTADYNFSASYVRTGDLVSGAIEVPVTFTLSYE